MLSLVQKITLGAAVAVAVAALFACSKTDKLAPSNACNPGQALTYTDNSGYQCRETYSSAAYQYSGMGLFAPPQGCKDSNQILINWNGSWLCYKSETLGTLPTGHTPPVGKGGEYCNSSTNYNSTNSYYSGIICSPGFDCRMGYNAGTTTQDGTCLPFGYYY